MNEGSFREAQGGVPDGRIIDRLHKDREGMPSRCQIVIQKDKYHEYYNTYCSHRHFVSIVRRGWRLLLAQAKVGTPAAASWVWGICFSMKSSNKKEELWKKNLKQLL